MDELEMEGEYALVLGDESTYGEADGPAPDDAELDDDESDGYRAGLDLSPLEDDGFASDLPEGTHLSLTFEEDEAA